MTYTLLNEGWVGDMQVQGIMSVLHNKCSVEFLVLTLMFIIGWVEFHYFPYSSGKINTALWWQTWPNLIRHSAWISSDFTENRHLRIWPSAPSHKWTLLYLHTVHHICRYQTVDWCNMTCFSVNVHLQTDRSKLLIGYIV